MFKADLTTVDLDPELILTVAYHIMMKPVTDEKDQYSVHKVMTNVKLARQ